MAKPTTALEVMQGMPAAFQAARAGKAKAVVQINLTGEGGGAWTVNIADGKCEVTEGVAQAPNATLTAAAADYLALTRGELNPMSAFMAGKLKVAGDLNLMMSFQNWFALG